MAMRTLVRRENLEFTGLSRRLLEPRHCGRLVRGGPAGGGAGTARGTRGRQRHRHPRRHRERDRRSSANRRASSRRSRPRTSASCRTPASRNRSRACRASPRSVPKAARRRSACAAPIPGFTTALLNGREQVSTGDNRSIEFDQYPSELLSSVVVYKTPDAQLVGQGLAGTIDLRTIAAARLRQARDGVQPARRAEFERRSRRRLRRQGLSRQLLLHRPVHGRHARRHLRLRAPRHRRWRRAAPAPTSRGIRRTAAAHRLPGRHGGRLRRQSGRRGRPVHHQRHEGSHGHGLDRPRRRHGDAAVSSRATPTPASSTCTTRRWSRKTTRAASR